jgi:hypothetical protein
VSFPTDHNCLGVDVTTLLPPLMFPPHCRQARDEQHARLLLGRGQPRLLNPRRPHGPCGKVRFDTALGSVLSAAIVMTHFSPAWFGEQHPGLHMWFNVEAVCPLGLIHERFIGLYLHFESPCRCGYYEDRRPASNLDPYIVTRLICESTLLM